MGPELGTELVPLPWLGDVVLRSDHYPATGQVSYGFGCLWSGVLVSTGGYWRGTCSGPMLWDVLGAHVVGRVRAMGRVLALFAYGKIGRESPH